MAFIHPTNGREDYAYFYRGKLDLPSSVQEFAGLVGRRVVFDATSTGEEWEELEKDVWLR